MSACRSCPLTLLCLAPTRNTFVQFYRIGWEGEIAVVHLPNTRVFVRVADTCPSDWQDGDWTGNLDYAIYDLKTPGGVASFRKKLRTAKEIQDD